MITNGIYSKALSDLRKREREAAQNGTVLTEEQKQIPRVGSLPADAELVAEPEVRRFMSFRYPLMTNIELSQMLRSKLQGVLHDLVGVRIIYNPTKGRIPGRGDWFDTKLFFQNNSSPIEQGKLKNLIDLTDPNGMKSGDALYAKKAALNNKISGIKYALNDETKLLLSRFMPDEAMFFPNQNNKRNWDAVIANEVINANGVNYVTMPNTVMYGQNEYITVTGFDTLKFMKYLFGSTIIYKVTTDINGKTVNKESDRPYYVLYYNSPNPVAAAQAGEKNAKFVCNVIVEVFDGNTVDEDVAKKNPSVYGTCGLIW